MSNPGSQPAQRVRRWCVRAAVVVGGIVTGSVAAWALSTAGAQAASAEHEPFSRVQEARQEFRQEVRKAAEKLSEAPRKAVESVHGAVRHTADEVGEALRGVHRSEKSAEQEGSRVDEEQSKAAKESQARPLRELDSLRQLSPLRDLSSLLAGVLHGGGQAELPKRPQEPEAPRCAKKFQSWCERIAAWFGPSRPDDVLPGLPGEEDFILVPDVPVFTGLPAVAAEAAHEDIRTTAAEEPVLRVAQVESVEQVNEGLSSASQSDEQDFPGEQAPLGAPGQPAATAPASGSAQAGHADGSPMAITAASAAAAACGVSMTLRRSIPGSHRPGGQPGVTPD